MLIFTPDNPLDVSQRTRGSLLTRYAEYRCVRIKSNPNAHPDNQIEFLSKHMAYSHVIEKHGPKFYGWDLEGRCVYVEELEGVSLERFVTQDINPWTVAGARLLEQVVNNARDLMGSLRQDKYTAGTTLLGYIVKPDMSVRQTDFRNLYYFGRFGRRYAEFNRFSNFLKNALEDNVFNRSADLTNAEFQAQMDTIDGMVTNLMP